MGSNKIDPVNNSRKGFNYYLFGIVNNFKNAYFIIGLLLLAILSYIILAPVVTLIWTTFEIQLVDSFRLPGFEQGDLSLHYWRDILPSSSVLHAPLANSTIVGIGTAVFVMVLGSIFAWLVTSTNLPFPGVFSALLIIPYILPSWALAFPWLQMFRNSGYGMPVGFLEYFTGIQTPMWVAYGPFAVIFVLGLHYYPFVFILVSGALKSIDSQMEEAASILGASRGRILRTITIPVVTPAIMSAAVLAFSRAVGTFGTPSILGMPVGFNVLAAQIRALMNRNQPSQAFILAFILIALCAFLLFVNSKIVGKRKSFVTIAGKGIKTSKYDLGKLRTPIAIALIIFMLAFIVFPLGLLTWSSFMLNEGSYGIDNFSLQYWIGDSHSDFVSGEPGILKNPLAIIGARNSITISVIGGLITAIIGLLAGYVIVKGRGKSKLSGIIEQISFMPLLIPSIAFGAIALSLFAVRRGPIPALYGTLAILILVTVGKQLPYTARSGTSAMHQVGGELEEAAEIQGASWVHRFRTIIWPLTKPGFISGFMIVIITTMRELSLFILLQSPRTQVLTTLTFGFFEIGARQLAYSLMTFLIILIFIILGGIKLVENFFSSKHDITQGGF